MIKLAFVFTQAPYGTATSREGLDALLAATAFCDESEIAVFFLDDGVLNIIANQQSEQILQKISLKLSNCWIYTTSNSVTCATNRCKPFSLNRQIGCLIVKSYRVPH